MGFLRLGSIPGDGKFGADVTDIHSSNSLGIPDASAPVSTQLQQLCGSGSSWPGAEFPRLIGGLAGWGSPASCALGIL